MTKQIEQAYRNNRRRSWLLIAAVVALAAAIAIPIAGGRTAAGSKTYTLAYTPESPTTVCNGSPATTVIFRLANTANPQTLGSAKLTLAATGTGRVTVTGATSSKGTVSPIVGNAFTITSMNVAKNVSADITVTMTGDTNGSVPVTVVAKQSTDFGDANDSTSNLFTLVGGAPSVTVAECRVAISGTVFKDVNGNGSRETAETTGVDGQIVTIGSSSTTTANGGTYSIMVPRSSNQLVCLTTQATLTETWTQTSPAAGTLNCNSASTTGITVPVGTTNPLPQDFLIAGGVTVPGCVNGTPPSGVVTSQNEQGTVTVRAKFAGDCDKIPGKYVFTTYSDSGKSVARLSPVGGTTEACTFTTTHSSTTSGCRVVTQQITWTVSNNMPNFSPLSYDDSIAGTAIPRNMKFCLKNPLQSAGDGLTVLGTDKPSDILPSLGVGSGDPANQGESYETTCLISSTQGPGPTPTRVDLVYTAVDGRVLSGG